VSHRSLGPCIAVGEVDPTDVDLETLVNGERRQRFNTRDMVFSYGECLEYLSRDFTLYPGDIISGGTAAGTAAGSSELLADGSSAPERFPGCGSAGSRRSCKAQLPISISPSSMAVAAAIHSAPPSSFNRSAISE
jgi:2-keto-4-pentenoate hydratase/2-oxohepta-3-ene-1,7-dioic acid hydratase in catechol pathway